MDYFFFQLAIIFLPGLLWERIATKYALKRPPSQFETVLRTFVFGLSAYAITFTIYGILGIDFIIPEVKRDAGFLERKFFGQFVATIAVSLLCAVLWLYFLNYKLLGTFLRSIGATKSYGQEDLWDFVFNSREPSAEYVYVRDYERGKIFSGWVKGFSQGEDVRELLLRDVQVYSLDGQLLYELPVIYLGRPREQVDIEFPVSGREA